MKTDCDSRPRALKDKVLHSILNRKKNGFSRIDVRRDSGASFRYIYDIVAEQVASGKLEEYDLNGQVKLYRAVKRPTSRKKSAPDVEPWIRMVNVRKEQLGSLTSVAAELGISKSTLSMSMNGKYGASIDKVVALVMAKYNEELVCCPVSGEISRCECMDNAAKAKALGIKGPAHIRNLRRACLSCKL